MTRLSSLGSLVVLLVATGLAFGAQLPPSSSPSPPVGAPPPAVDGFTRTSRYLQICEQKGAEIEAVLRTLHAESTADSRGDKAGQRAAFLKKLTSVYPGSTFDG